MLFTHDDQHPSSGASGLVSFGRSEKDFDYIISLATSDVEKWSNPAEDSATPLYKEVGDTRPWLGSELVHVLSKAVEELGLECSAPEEPQAPHQQPAPFFPEVHEELAKSWNAPYSVCIHYCTSSGLPSVDSVEQKGHIKPH